ncbi:hypothetical protein E2C01_039020 [Portunus trituberculatus]|uniref:Uncharacterized protein n=1 Tax=Portunus trituberculatus TaxID=210409 RepID=A0A5B7FLM5_PORTR|nr:hypothetical protein [Portunus trituberculatus]
MLHNNYSSGCGHNNALTQKRHGHAPACRDVRIPSSLSTLHGILFFFCDPWYRESSDSYKGSGEWAGAFIHGSMLSIGCGCLPSPRTPRGCPSRDPRDSPSPGVTHHLRPPGAPHLPPGREMCSETGIKRPLISSLPSPPPSPTSSFFPPPSTLVLPSLPSPPSPFCLTRQGLVRHVAPRGFKQAV